MAIIAEPLNIGASDLLKGVEYTYCGALHVKCDTLLGRKWKQRYVIISHGCIYIYTNRNAKKTEQSYSLKQFESAIECDPESGESICFCLRHKNGQTPILFSCDTFERREKWIGKLCSAISEIQSTLNNVSADSGFGSAATVPRNKLKVQHGKEQQAMFDEIGDRNIEETPYSTVKACDEDIFGKKTAAGRSHSMKTGNLYANLEDLHKDDDIHEIPTAVNVSHRMKTENMYANVKDLQKDDDIHEIATSAGVSHRMKTENMYANVEDLQKGVSHSMYANVEDLQKEPHLLQPLKSIYKDSRNLNQYLFHGLERSESVSFGFVPSLKIINNDGSGEVTYSIEEALTRYITEGTECQHEDKSCQSCGIFKTCHNVLFLADETALPGYYLVHTWLQSFTDENRDVNNKFMSQFEAVFLIEITEIDRKVNLKELIASHFQIEKINFEENIMIIFACKGKNPLLLSTINKAINTSDLSNSTFITITDVDRISIAELKLNAERELVTDGLESILVTPNEKGSLNTDDGILISRYISQIVSKSKLIQNYRIDKVDFQNLKSQPSQDVVIYLPQEISSIQIRSCDLSCQLVHSAQTLKLDVRNILYLHRCVSLEGVFSSTLTSISVSFSGKSNIFHKRMYTHLAFGLYQHLGIRILSLCDMKIGTKVITLELSENEIEQLKQSVKTKDDYRRYGARILGPHLGQMSFHKTDVDTESRNSSSFAAYVLLDLICYELVKKHDAIVESYPATSEDNKTVLICFLRKDIDINCFKGFTVVRRTENSVSKESLHAENACYNDKLSQKAIAEEFVELNETLSYHADSLMENHKNLEAVKISYVKSSKNLYEHPHPCIVLYCKVKGYIPFGERCFPKRLKHPFKDKTYETDVREGFFTICPYLTSRSTEWNKELALGCSIGEMNADIAGTLGPFVNIKDTGETCFLTVRHAFPPLPPLRRDSQTVGVKVVQPADIHLSPIAGSMPERLCGEIIVSQIEDGEIDAALVKVCPERVPTRGHFVNITRDDLNFAGLSPTSLPTYDDGAYMDAKTLTVKDNATRRIIKIGSTTSLTKGTLSTTDGVVRETAYYTTLENLYNGSREKYAIKSQLMVDSYVKKIFCQAGDSGSAVFLVDDSNRLFCIGMVIGLIANDCTAVVTPIKNILDILGRQLGKELELKTFDLEKMDEQ